MSLFERGPDPKPIGNEPTSDEVRRVKEIDDLVLEANSVRVMRNTDSGSDAMSLEDVWERNGKRFLGDHWSMSGSPATFPFTEGDKAPRDPRTNSRRFTLNRTQGAIISQRAMAFERPEVFRFTPVESTGESVSYIRPDVGSRLLAAIQGGQIDVEAEGLTGFSPEQLSGQEPIPTRETVLLTAGISGQGLLSEEDLIHLNDETVTRMTQKVWDVLYKEHNSAYHVATNELYSSIFGHQPLLFRWDSENHGFRLSNPHVLNVWIDPTAETVEEAEYLVMDVTLSFDKAIANWPDLKDELQKAKETGELKRNCAKLAAPYRVDFKRDMVTVRIAWQRNKMVPLTEEEALAEGLVIEEEIPIIDLETGGVSGVQTQLVKAETGGRTKPGAKNWPERLGILQTQTIPAIKRRVSEIRCPYWDIPIAWNKNIPIPYSPYGQGEPERVEDLQQAINRLFTIIHNHARYYQAPMEFWPEDLYHDLKSRGFSPYAKPGRILPVRNDIYQMMVALGGSSGFGVINQVPPIPSFYVKLLELLLAEHDRLSGFNDVLQGAAPSSDISGRAIEALQSAARGPIGVKTAFTEWMLERIARIGLDAIRKWLPEAKWVQILDNLPFHVVQEVQKRISLTSYDVTVEIVSGRGINKAMDMEKAVQLYQGGAPTRLISRETAQQLADIKNRDDEARKIDAENRAQMALLAGQGVPAGGAQPQ